MRSGWLANPNTAVALSVSSVRPHPLTACLLFATPLTHPQAHAAILLVKEDGQAQVVVGEYEGKAFKGPHSATIDSGGQLFFTDCGPFGETSLLEPQGSVFVVTGEANNRILRPLAYERLACPTGIALSPEESCVYVAEMAANRILRFVQRPANVWHATVFHQFSGRMGPTAVCCDSGRGLIYVARYELPEFAERGVISVLSPEGQLLKDLDVPGPEVTGLALSQDGSYLLVTEATTNAVHKLLL